MFFCTISPFFFPKKIDMNFLTTCYSNSEAEVRVFPYQLVAEINNWVAYKETMCTWALPSWFIMQLGKCLILQSMNCKASTSPLSLLFFQTSHSQFFNFSSHAASSGKLPSTTPYTIKRREHLQYHLDFYDYVTVLDTYCVLCFSQAADFPALIYWCRRTSVADEQVEKNY